MHGRPIWGVSAWGGFVCALLALSSLMNGAVDAGTVMLFGAVVLVGWAIWLAHHKH
jgi:hypothetical protein